MSVPPVVAPATISILAPARGATHATYLAFYSSTNFNPRSREGSDQYFQRNNIIYIDISILAPARGATRAFLCNAVDGYNFNPRSREGSDRLCDSKHLCQRDFNPRSREGSD